MIDDRVPPKIDMILSFVQSQALNWHSALSEFVDNSLGPGAGNASRVMIDLYRDRIEVIDNGSGLKDINELFQLGGGTSRYRKSDIGLYGMGSKQAQLWIGSDISVDTIRDGLRHIHRFEWPIIWFDAKTPSLKRGADWPKRYLGAGKECNGKKGTAITIRGLHPGKPNIMAPNVAQSLGITYGPAIRKGAKIVMRDFRYKANDPRVYEIDPDEPKNKTDQYWYDGEVRGMKYKLYISRHEPRENRHNGLFISWGHRVVSIEKNPWPRPLPSHFYGRLELADSWKRCLSTNKLDIASHKEELLEDAYSKCCDRILAFEEYERELRLQIYVEGMGLELGRVMIAIENSKNGSYKVAERIYMGGHGGGGKGAKRAEPGGDCEAKDKKVKTLPVIIKDAELGEVADRVLESNGGFQIELNRDIPYISDAFRFPFNGSAIWGMVVGALVDHLVSSGHKLSEKFGAGLFADQASPRMRAEFLRRMPDQLAPKGKSP
jgi:hypothetical protein